MGLGFNEILIILVIILLLFGAKKIPELMRGVGKGMREFSDAKNNAKREMENELHEEDNKNGAPISHSNSNAPT